MKYLLFLFSLLLVSASTAYGHEFPTTGYDVVSGATNCTATKTAGNTWQASFSISWLEQKETHGSSGERSSRAFVIYQYNNAGKPINDYIRPNDIRMNGVAPIVYYPGEWHNTFGYLTISGENDPASWRNFAPNTASVTINVKRADVAMIGVWPANHFYLLTVLDYRGVLFFSPSLATSSCQWEDWPNSPREIVNITMNAPDWTLGEIGSGKQQKVLTNSADRLCINYLSTESKGKDFIINATNANGKVNNRFVLKHSLKPTISLPYTLTLDDTGKKLLLPNSNNSSVKFDSSGNQTCFTPTFDLYGSDNQEPGDYSDVITYEIVTKS